MAEGTKYKNVDVALDDVTSDTQRQPVPGAEGGVAIYGVAIVRQNFVDAALPAGAQVKLYFGPGGDEILLSDDLVSFEFPCGHSTGIYFANTVALPAKVLRLLVDYSGGLVTYAR